MIAKISSSYLADVNILITHCVLTHVHSVRGRVPPYCTSMIHLSYLNSRFHVFFLHLILQLSLHNIHGVLASFFFFRIFILPSGWTDGWMDKTSNITPLSRPCFTVSNAVLKLFQALDPASIISLSLPHFLSFWILKVVTTSSQENCNEEKSLPWRNSNLRNGALVAWIITDSQGAYLPLGQQHMQ